MKLFVTCFNRTKFLKNTQNWRKTLYSGRFVSFLPRKLACFPIVVHYTNIIILTYGTTQGICDSAKSVDLLYPKWNMKAITRYSSTQSVLYTLTAVHNLYCTYLEQYTICTEHTYSSRQSAPYILTAVHNLYCTHLQ
jgi:hypothetical protein